MKHRDNPEPPHPGEMLSEYYLKPLGINISDAAPLLQITRPNLSKLVNGKAGISPLMARKLARAFDTTPQFWMNLQTEYDLWYSANYDDDISDIKQLN